MNPTPAHRVRLVKGVVTDAAGNLNLETESINAYGAQDTSNPTTSIQALDDYTNSAINIVTVRFEDTSATVSGMNQSELSVSGSAGLDETSGAFYEFAKEVQLVYRATSEGSTTFAVASGVATDEAGHPNDESQPLTVWYDATPPSVFLSVYESASPLVLTVEFSDSGTPEGCRVKEHEALASDGTGITFVHAGGEAAGDILQGLGVVDGSGTVSNDGCTMSFNLAWDGGGAPQAPYRVQLAPDASRDAAGNGNLLTVSQDTHAGRFGSSRFVAGAQRRRPC